MALNFHPVKIRGIKDLKKLLDNMQCRFSRLANATTMKEISISNYNYLQLFHHVEVILFSVDVVSTSYTKILIKSTLPTANFNLLNFAFATHFLRKKCLFFDASIKQAFPYTFPTVILFFPSPFVVCFLVSIMGFFWS